MTAATYPTNSSMMTSCAHDDVPRVPCWALPVRLAVQVNCTPWRLILVCEGEEWDEVDTASPGRHRNTGHCVTHVKSNMVLVAGESNIGRVDDLATLTARDCT